MTEYPPYDPEVRYPNITAHRLIAEVATAMAQEVYEQLCSGSNALYQVHGDRNDAIRQWAPMLVKAAKVQLGQMLNSPTVSDYEKEQIYEALCLDAMLPKGGLSVTPKPH